MMRATVLTGLRARAPRASSSRRLAQTLAQHPPTVGRNKSLQRTLSSAFLAGLVVLGSTVVTAPTRAEDAEQDDEHVFVNWSASHECRPREFFVPESVEEVERLLQSFDAEKRKLRCMGAGVSPNGLGFSGELRSTHAAKESRHEALMSMALFDKILEVDREQLQVTVEAGIIVGDLLDKLRTYGMTMQNVASIRDQQLGGITQAGCHGSGARIPPIDDQVIEMEIITPAQGRMVLSDTQNPELFALAKCGLGALGVVTKLKLQCVPAHYLAERTSVATVDEIRKHHSTWLEQYQHLRYMWIPNTDTVVVVQCERISEEEAKQGDARFPPPAHSRDEQLKAPRELYLQLAQGKPDPNYLEWNFTKLRDKLLEFNPLDKQHVKNVNQVEKAF